MGIYHLHLQNISRSSGRSATGAAAYRAGEKLRLVEKAAYRAGEELRDQDTQITHDYTKKSGVVHKEIILPEDAPPEFEDRETLWNFVDASEKRKDARLAKEINVALPTEFDLDEQIEVLHKYIKENFTDKGVIVDLNVHNTGNGNPHAHLMFPTRHVTPEGFGKKNTDLDSKVNLLIWRESWAKINNHKFEEKGLDERIDHRTLEAQGINREPTVHMGHKAWALEKKGVQTERGNINRDIKRRNDERAAKAEAECKDDPQDGNATSDNKPPALKKWGGSAERDALMSAKRNIREIETHLKAEKAEQIVEKLQEQREARRETEKIARHLNELKETDAELDKELHPLLRENETYKREIPQLDYLIEGMDEHIKNIEMLQDKVAQIQAEYQKLPFWEGKRKKELAKEIEKLEGNIRVARHNFKKKYGIDPEQAIIKIQRVREKIRERENAIERNNVQISKIRERQAAIRIEYQTQKLLNESRPDRQQIEQLLEKMNKPPESVRERLRQNELDRRLNTITKEDFQKIIEKLPQKQAEIIIKERQRAEMKKLQEQAQKEKTIIIERDR